MKETLHAVIMPMLLYKHKKSLTTEISFIIYSNLEKSERMRIKKSKKGIPLFSEKLPLDLESSSSQDCSYWF